MKIYLPDFRFLKEFEIEFIKEPNQKGGYYKQKGDYFLEYKGKDWEVYDFITGTRYIILSNIGGIDDSRSYDELLELMNDINYDPDKYYINDKREVFLNLKSTKL